MFELWLSMIIYDDVDDVGDDEDEDNDDDRE